MGKKKPPRTSGEERTLTEIELRAKIASVLRTARKARNLDQVTVAKKIGKRPPTYNRYEKGVEIPPPDVAQELCTMFNLDWEEMRWLLRRVWEESLPLDLRVPPRDKLLAEVLRTEDERELIRRWGSDPQFRDAISGYLRPPKKR